MRGDGSEKEGKREGRQEGGKERLTGGGRREGGGR